ncbi:hypothetical protein LWI28_008601 [Acer negundo]|uniref:Uncharacterized protein n=1 Tax=Acer negundo TaxID=4023 RepID=A0AAD5IPI0_ACENE|nr:hypothetical protein LWI28_008601 [Acer negundo]
MVEVKFQLLNLDYEKVRGVKKGTSISYWLWEYKRCRMEVGTVLDGQKYFGVLKGGIGNLEIEARLFFTYV